MPPAAGLIPEIHRLKLAVLRLFKGFHILLPKARARYAVASYIHCQEAFSLISEVLFQACCLARSTREKYFPSLIQMVPHFFIGRIQFALDVF